VRAAMNILASSFASHRRDRENSTARFRIGQPNRTK
jgi:hypothetical protein